MPPRKTKAKTKTETAPKRKRGQQPDTQAEEEAAVPDRSPAPAVAEKEQADRLATSVSSPASSGHSTDGNGDEEQQQEQDSVPRGKPRGKGKKVLLVTQLPELKDKAEEITEWWMSYPQLYDKTKLAYHDVVKKKDIITTKAVELGVSYDTLKRWMTHYRDEYYKIMNKVEQAERSGAGLDDVRLTERERWLYGHLGWLKVHHQPQKNRTVVGLGHDPHTHRHVREAEEEEGDTQESAPQDDPQPDDEPGEGAARPPSAAGSATSAASAATRGHKKAPAPAVLTQSRVNLAVATQVRTATHEMQDRITGLVNRMATRDATPDHQWGRWLGSVSDELHPDLQREWQERTFALTQDFRERSRELYRREAQQLPMPFRQPQSPALSQTPTQTPMQQHQPQMSRSSSRLSAARFPSFSSIGEFINTPIPFSSSMLTPVTTSGSLDTTPSAMVTDECRETFCHRIPGYEIGTTVQDPTGIYVISAVPQPSGQQSGQPQSQQGQQMQGQDFTVLSQDYSSTSGSTYHQL